MKTKVKEGVWKLTGSLARNTFTTIWDTIYYPKGITPWQSIIAHEEYHYAQQRAFAEKFGWLGKRASKWVGLSLWIWLYLVGLPLGLPILWNPWRWKWEWEAYMKGSGYSVKKAESVLKSGTYGWLIFH